MRIEIIIIQKMPKRKTKEEFILNANLIHKNKYDYNKVDYVNTTTKVIIICHDHGEFLQTPKIHINSKCMCPKCAKAKIIKIRSKDFILKAKKIHKNKYDYSKSIYSHSSTKLIITCPIHGDFLQGPSSHLRGKGCYKCGKIKMNTNTFILKSGKIHNHKYDYSKSIYINSFKELIIICPIHGDFLQKPTNHLNNCGCQKCGKLKQSKKKITQKEENKKIIKKIINKNILQKKNFYKFKIEANKIYKNQYDYSNSIFINYVTKIKIICKTIGEFFQSPRSHLINYKKNKKKFIRKSEKIHKNKYDYRKSIYISYNIKLIITCPIHGDFLQTPSSHLYGYGCQICGKIEGIKKNSDTLSQFIKKANLIHNFLYDYTKVNYINSKTKINIICNKHGSYFQKPKGHLNGRGCPTCKSSKGEIKILTVLKLLNLNYKKEQKFNKCKNIKLLPFDYIVTIKDKILLIEYDGEPHFKLVKYFMGGENGFLNRKRRDRIKNIFCLETNKLLLRISYLEYNDIEKWIKFGIEKLKRGFSGIIWSNPQLYQTTFYPSLIIIQNFFKKKLNKK